MKKQTYKLYMHTSPNNKRYIGITKNAPEKRWGKNGYNYKSQLKFYRAIKKYGWNNFNHEIIFQNLLKEEAEMLEIEIIKFYKSNNPKYGYNVEGGGSCKGEITEEQRLRLSMINKGRKHTDETKNKMSLSRKGRKIGEEGRKNISLAKMGNKNPNYGKRPSKESIEKGLKGKIKAVICLETNIIYNSIKEASEAIKVHSSNISKCCNGHALSVKGFTFQFYKNGEILNNRYVAKKNGKAIKCVETGINYNSIAEASKFTKIKDSSISGCCNKNRKTAGGYHWIFT